jgi:hypothetical protein
LKRTNQIEDLSSRSGDKNDPPRCSRCEPHSRWTSSPSRTGIVRAPTHSFLSALTKLSGAASKTFLSSPEQK